MKPLKKKNTRKDFRCCYGISSKGNAENHHVLFMDYDNLEYENVVEHIQYIQHEYNLGDVYLIESLHKNDLRDRNSFNAICLDVLPLAECHRILADIVSPVDRDFTKYGFERGYYTLRFDKDKEFLGIIRSDNGNREKSLAHKKFLEWFFDIEIPISKLFNNYDVVQLVQFPSIKNGYHIVDKEIPSYFNILRA